MPYTKEQLVEKIQTDAVFKQKLQALSKEGQQAFFKRAMGMKETSQPERGYTYPSAYATAGPIGRGVEAVEKGAQWEDILGLLAKAISGFYGDAPEQVAEKPMATARGGLVSTMGTPGEEERQLPFPRPVTTEGKKLGEELETAGLIGRGAEMTSAVAPLVKGGTRITKALLRRTKDPAKMLAKAKKLVVELLQPSTQELAQYYSAGKEHPAVQQAMKTIGKAKNYDELITQIKSQRIANMTQRNAILKRNNYTIGNEYLDDLTNLIKQKMNDGVTSDAEIMKYIKIYEEQLKTLGKRGGRITRLMAQKLRQNVDDLVTKPLEKIVKGQTIVADPAKTQAYTALRTGLKKVIEGGDADVARLNSTYGGLLKAEKLLHGQKALAAKSIQPGFLEKVSGALRSVFYPRSAPASVAAEAAKGQRSLSRTTGKIRSLYKHYGHLVPEEVIKPVGAKPSQPGAKPSQPGARLLTGPAQQTRGIPTSQTKQLPKPETIYGPGFQTTNPQQAQEAINLQKFQQQYIQPVSNIRESSSAITPKGSQIMQLVEELLRRRGMQ